jgi:hypothetical protein
MHETLYSCGFSRTLSFVTMRLWIAQSQWKNVGFPQFSWVFHGFLAKIACFCRVSATFGAGTLDNPHYLPSSMQSEKHLPLRRH